MVSQQTLLQSFYPAFSLIVSFVQNSIARRMRNPQVLLKEISRAFCKVAHAHKRIGHGLSPRKSRYFTMKYDVLGRSCSALPTDVPKGQCAVYVANECSRFVIPTIYLNHSVFQSLLNKAEEEYGFDHHIGLTILCDEADFQYLTSLLGNKGCRR